MVLVATGRDQCLALIGEKLQCLLLVHIQIHYNVLQTFIYLYISK